MHLAMMMGHSPSPHVVGQWRLARSFRGFSFERPSYWEHMGRVLERGRFDMLFLVDTFNLADAYGGSPDRAIEYAVQFPFHDPLPLVPIVASATRHLGIGVTISTTFSAPFATARTLATLDHLTEGRVGWNVVTSFGSAEAANFGLDDMVPHDQRYARADEYMDVCYKLWDSWADDAVVADRASGRWANPERVRRIDHEGTYYRCRGPLSVIPSPQGRPTILQAGQSPAGLAFAAKHADVHFAVRESPAGMRKHIAMVEAALEEAGRPRDALSVLWGVNVIVAETEDAARAKARELESQITPEAGLVMLAGKLNYDLSQLPLDEPLRNLEVEGIRGVLNRLIEDLDEGMSLAEIGRYHGAGIGPRIVGSGEQVADQLDALYDAVGNRGGFMLCPGALPGSLEDFVDLVVPHLQERSLLRREYDDSSLRERFAGR